MNQPLSRSSETIRPLLASLLCIAALSGCAAVGNLDTAAMQTTNKAVGAPVNGPGTR